MLVDVSRYFLALGLLLAGFSGLMLIVLSVPALQWSGADAVIWPTAVALLVISTTSTVINFVPRGKRAIAASPHKKSFAIGFFFVALYTGIGIGTLILIPFRMASGI